MSAWTAYLLACLPGWLLGGCAAWMLAYFGVAPFWATAVVLGLWVSADFARFRRVRHYYQEEPADRRMIGKEGTAVSDIAPAGFARVHGELWQVRVADRGAAIAKGARLRVRDIKGLELIVESA